MELGYRFISMPIPGHPAMCGLEVVIHAHPTQKHFDPEKIRVSIVTEKQLFATAIISLPWHAYENYRYTAGLIRINDRYQKVIDIFSFGGDLQIYEDPTRLSATFHTPAPMFDKITSGSTCELLASMFEGLLAWRKGAWADDPEQFEKRLLALDPADLYWLFIDELVHRYADLKELTPQFESLLQFLNEEHQRLLTGTKPPTIKGSIVDYL